MRIGNLSTRRFLSCLGLSAMLAGGLTSCKKEYFELDRVKDPTWNPELAVPLINSTITVPEVLDRFDDDDIIVVDSTGILALKYFSEIFSAQAPNILPLLDQNIAVPASALTPADIATLTGGNQVSSSGTVPYTFDFTNLATTPEMTSFTFKGGTLTMQVSSQHTYPANVTLTIPGLTLNGVPFSRTVNGVVNGSPSTINQDLTGYVMDLTQGPSGFNELELTGAVVLNPGGSGNPGDRVDVALNLTSLQFSLAQGDLKQQSINDADTVRIRFFENFQDGDVYWEDPRVKAIFTNFFGADIEIDLNTFLADSRDNGQIPISGPLDNPIVIASSPTIGGSATTEVDINRTNSNIKAVAENEPQKIIYDFSSRTNPGGPANNWITDTSSVRLDMEVYLPFHGRAVDFSKADTTDVDIFPLDDDIEEIVSVTFRLTIDNGFPAEAFAQVYFYDTTFSALNPVAPLDSLFPVAREVVFASPTPDANGVIDQENKERTVVDITVDRDKLQRLEAGGFGKLVAVGWINTTDMGSTVVKVFRDYELDLKLGMLVEAKVKIPVN